MATLYGSNKPDRFLSYADGVTDDSDWIYGYDGYDRISGLGGDDWLQGGRGGDDLFGGAGFDRADYSDSDTGVYVVLPSSTGLAVGWGSGGSAEGDLLWSIEALTGSFFHDTLIGNDDVNVLWGLDGSDTLYGMGGRDYLYGSNDTDRLYGGDGADYLAGGAGTDYLYGEAGADEMQGGTGNDFYVVDDPGDLVMEAAGQGRDVVYVTTTTTYVLPAGSEIEIVQPQYPADTTALDLVGNEFGNWLIGNNAANTLVGGMGQDYFTGYGGSDNFTWTSTAETSVAGELADVVADFQPGLDRLVVSPIDANDPMAGDQAFSFVGMIMPGAFTAPGQIGYFTADTNGDGAADQTYILLNTDGDPFQEATIRLVGVYTVEESWFVL